MKHRFINSVQKGFMRGVDDCMEHDVICKELIHDARKERKDIHVIAIDFKDAFSSVPTEYAIEALREIGIPNELVNTINELYIYMTTKFRIGNRTTNEIPGKMGFKQGCPLRPLFFFPHITTTLE